MNVQTLANQDAPDNCYETTAEIIPIRPARGKRHWSSWVKDCRPVKLQNIPVSSRCMYAVMSCLGQHADPKGLSFPSVATIADITHYSPRQVRYALRALQAQGFLRTQERKIQHGRLRPTNTTNHYQLADDPVSEIEQPPVDDLPLYAPPPAIRLQGGVQLHCRGGAIRLQARRRNQ